MPEIAGGLVVAIGCTGPSEGGVDVIELYSYDSPESYGSAVGVVLQGLEQSSCPEGGWNTWTDGNGDERGVLACYYGDAGEAIAVWTHNTDGVVVVASDAEMLLDEMYVWWQSTVPARGLN